MEFLKLLGEEMSDQLQKLYPYLTLVWIEVSKFWGLANENKEDILTLCQITVAFLTVCRLTLDIRKKLKNESKPE